MSIEAIPESVHYVKVISSYLCSRGCGYCYNTILGQSIASEPARVLASLQDIIKSAEGSLDVEFIGGEPLQRPIRDETLKLLRFAKESGTVRQVFMSSALTSAKVMSIAMPFIDSLYLSVDFTSSGNRKPLNASQLSRVVSIAAKENTAISVSSVLHGDETLDDMLRFIEVLETCGIKSWGFSHQSYLGLSPALLSRYTNQYYDAFRVSVVVGDRVSVSNGIIDSLKIQLKGGSRDAACECARHSVVIEPDGSLSPGVCQDHVRGRLSPKEFIPLQETRSTRLQASECKGCPLWNVCYGGCMTEATRLTGSPNGRSIVECHLLTELHRRVSFDQLAFAGV